MKHATILLAALLLAPLAAISAVAATPTSKPNIVFILADHWGWGDLSCHDQSAVLLQLGKWLKKNGECIYGTSGGPFKPWAYGGTTRRGKTIYVHVLNWPSGGLKLPPVVVQLVHARWLSGGQVESKQTDAGLEILVPEADRQKTETVVAMEFAGDVMKLPAVEVPENKSHADTTK